MFVDLKNLEREIRDLRKDLGSLKYEMRVAARLLAYAAIHVSEPKAKLTVEEAEKWAAGID